MDDGTPSVRVLGLFDNFLGTLDGTAASSSLLESSRKNS